MKHKASTLLILTLIAFCLFGAASRAQAWSWWDDPGPLVFVQPRVLIGYMLPTRTNALNVNMYGPQISSGIIPSIQQTAKMEGLWTELVVPVKSVYPIGFTPSVGYLIPADYRVDETYQGNSGQIAKRTWRTKTTLYNLKFSIDYAFSQSVTAMLGFQYDSFMADYRAPYDQVSSDNVGLNSAQRVGLEVSLGIPFVGVMYERNIGSIFDLKAYISGYPGIPGVLSFEEAVQFSYNGNAEHSGVKFSQEISSGYFYEAFAQLSTPVWRGIGGGAFVKYSEFSGKLIGVSVDHRENPGADSISADVTYLRNSFVIGASITALF